MPQPKASKKKKKKESVDLEEVPSPAKKIARKKKGKATDLPPDVVWTFGKQQSVEEAMSKANTWSQINKIN